MLLNLYSQWQGPPPPPPPPFFEDMPLLLDYLEMTQGTPPVGLEPNPRRLLHTGHGSGIVTPDFDVIAPGESDVFTFDFSRDMRDDETVTTVQWDCALAQTLDGFTADTSPGDHIDGVANAGTITYPVSGKVRWLTNQLVSNMADGNYYYLRATITVAPIGRVIKRWSRVLCQDEGYPP